MLDFLGDNHPSGLLLEPVSANVLKFDNIVINVTEDDKTTLQTFTAALREEIETLHYYLSREIYIEDTTNHLKLALCARYNAIMHLQVTQTETEENLTPLYCVCSTIELVELLESLLQ